MSELMTIRVDRKTKARREKLAKETERTASRLVVEAIRSYVDVNEWQIAGIKAALKEADEGKFATDREVQATLRKLRKCARDQVSRAP
jgi:RHH-type transcriptional regulator, rel operon repressor / antitoxin RelB